MAERPPVGQPAGGPLLERSPGPAGDPSRPEPEAASQPAGDAPGERRLRGLPLPLIGAAAGAVVVLGAIGYLLPPRLAPLLADDTLDPARLPNTSAVAAGTPVAQLAVARPTPAAGAPEQPASTPGSAPAAASGPSGAQPQPTSAPGATLLDERFGPATTGWPTTSQRTAWLGDDSYQLATRRAGQFVAISAPLVQVPSNVVVSATFHKVGGPAGGGYGIIVRDQGPDAQDGVSQAGRYYVLEVGDKGEAGIWRRETDHWVDLLPWQRTDAVKPGTASNELTVRAIGNVLSLVVNGVEVGARTDATYPGGRVGIFVGGDGNQVALERFTVQTP
jgi:hypothetical protein